VTMRSTRSSPPGEPALRRWPWALIWALVAVGVVLVRRDRVSAISNDGTQYVESARQLMGGHGYTTTLLFFDEHHAAGVMPAPQTGWPPGYSLAIAAVSSLGLGLESSARLVAQVAFVAVAPLVFLIACRLTGNPILASLATLWQLGITELWMYLAEPNSELPFLALSLAALAVLPRKGGGNWRWGVAGVLGGLCVTMRYAGAFLLVTLAGAALLAVWDRWRLERRLVLLPLVLLAPGTALAVAPLIRNQLLVGSLTGYHVPASQPVGNLLSGAASGLVDVLGGAAPADFTSGGPHIIFAGLSLLALAAASLVTLVTGARMLRRFGLEREDVRYGLVLAGYAAIYQIGVIATASGSMRPYSPRYALPIAPIVICLIVYLLSARPPAPVAEAS
jgi:4-amino-4-deoxy-L-arabinose transferase-like glycosyltransferase